MQVKALAEKLQFPPGYYFLNTDAEGIEFYMLCVSKRPLTLYIFEMKLALLD